MERTLAPKKVVPLKASSLCRGSLYSDDTVVLAPPDAWSDSNLQIVRDLWSLNERQLALLQTLGRNLVDILHFKNTPDQAIRFLIAHKYHLITAERYFRNMIQWRLDHKVDTIQPPPPDVIQYFPGAILKGRDKQGDPIFVNRNGAINAVLFFEQYGYDDFIHYVIWIRELVTRGEWRTKFEETRPAKCITIIDDLQGLKLWSVLRHPTILRAFAEGMRIDQDYYPEGSKRIFVIRAPGMFETLWKICRSFFDPLVREKMTFCNRDTYQTTLSQFMDLKVLPREVTPFGLGTVDIGMPTNFAGVQNPREIEASSRSEVSC